MFGFRNRKEYNGTVDVKLNNEYQIKTRDNPNFPGILKYLELIDVSWNDKATEDECAMQIATLYLSGLIRHALRDERRVVADRFGQVGPYGVERGLIRKEIWEKCVALIEKTQREVAEVAPTVQPLTRGSRERPIIIDRPRQVEAMRQTFRGKLAGTDYAAATQTDAELDAMIAEFMKMSVLEEMLGKQGVNWQCGKREYREGAIQTQEIIFKDGRASTVLFFDFSRFGNW